MNQSDLQEAVLNAKFWVSWFIHQVACTGPHLKIQVKNKCLLISNNLLRVQVQALHRSKVMAHLTIQLPKSEGWGIKMGSSLSFYFRDIKVKIFQFSRESLRHLNQEENSLISCLWHHKIICTSFTSKNSFAQTMVLFLLECP